MYEGFAREEGLRSRVRCSASEELIARFREGVSHTRGSFFSFLFAYIKKKLYLCSGFWEKPEKLG